MSQIGRAETDIISSLFGLPRLPAPKGVKILHVAFGALEKLVRHASSRDRISFSVYWLYFQTLLFLLHRNEERLLLASRGCLVASPYVRAAVRQRRSWLPRLITLCCRSTCVRGHSLAARQCHSGKSTQVALKRQHYLGQRQVGKVALPQRYPSAQRRRSKQFYSERRRCLGRLTDVAAAEQSSNRHVL